MVYDIIIVLAGGLDENGNIYEWVKRRLDNAIKEFNKKETIILCLGGGTYHKPPYINKDGFVLHESSACINYLKDIGKIHPKFLLKEWSSYDTIGNVYFSLVDHILLMNIKKILVITSEFHMERSKILFDWIYNLEEKDKYDIYFKSVSDDGLESVVSERINREKKSVENIKINLIPKINNMRDLHDWLYLEHNAYSSYDSIIEYIPNSVKNTY